MESTMEQTYPDTPWGNMQRLKEKQAEAARGSADESVDKVVAKKKKVTKKK